MCGQDGVAGDVIITSRRRCTGSMSRRSQQSQETGLLARRARVERKREKLEAWKPRIKILQHEVRLWERKEGSQNGSGVSFEEGHSEEVWRDCMEVEDDAECRRKLDEPRKKMQRELREVERLSFASKDLQDRGRMWKRMGKELNLRGMWQHFYCERSKAKKFRQLADEEKQAGIQGQWQQESPAKEHLEQVKCCHDTDCNESMMKKGFTQRLFWPSFNEQHVYLLLNSSLSAQIFSTRTKNTCTPREDKSSLHSHNQDGRKQKNLT